MMETETIQEEILEQEQPIDEMDESQPQEEAIPFVPAPTGSLYAEIDENHKLKIENQVIAFEKGLPAVEFETAWNGDLYEKGYAPEKPVEEKKSAVREVRDRYINDIEWRVSRYRDQKDIEVETTDTEETFHKILQYMQYLRDYPESSVYWYEHNPMTWDEYKGV